MEYKYRHIAGAQLMEDMVSSSQFLTTISTEHIGDMTNSKSEAGNIRYGPRTFIMSQNKDPIKDSIM